jgi:hypothetical protein
VNVFSADVKNNTDLEMDKCGFNARHPTWEKVQGCTQKFPYWPPGARTENGTALCP